MWVQQGLVEGCQRRKHTRNRSNSCPSSVSSCAVIAPSMSKEGLDERNHRQATPGRRWGREGEKKKKSSSFPSIQWSIYLSYQLNKPPVKERNSSRLAQHVSIGDITFLLSSNSTTYRSKATGSRTVTYLLSVKNLQYIIVKSSGLCIVHKNNKKERSHESFFSLLLYLLCLLLKCPAKHSYC